MLFVSLILVADARGPTQVSLSREPTKVTYSIEREVSHDRTCFARVVRERAVRERAVKRSVEFTV